MPTLAKAAYGTIFKVGAVTVPELTNITDVGISSTLIDVTAHDGASAFGSRIPSFLDGGTVRATFNWVPADTAQISLRTALLNRVSTAFSVTWPTTGNPTTSFNAFVTRYRIPAAPVNAQLQLEVEFSVDGAVTFA
jgi:hypothetical protein